MAHKADLKRVDAAKGYSSTDSEVGIDQVRRAIHSIRYGEVRVVIQDGLIVQIDRVEKQRLR
jgi:hypothetical protein